MDNFVEQVVKRKKNTKFYVSILIYVLLAILIPATFVVLTYALRRAYFMYIAIFVAIFCVYGLWYLITALNIEYEYANLSGTFRVDKIIAKRNRKKVLKLEVKTIDDIFKYSDSEMSKRSFNKVYNVGADDFSESNYVFTFVSDAKGKCAVVFTPDEKTLNSFKPYLKRDIVRNIF